MRIKFVFLVLLQIVLLVGMIAYKEYWIATGEKILLRTVPVDPRDIFRGDYVQLRYEITNLNLDNLSVKESFKPNETIYVILEKDTDNTFRASSASKSIPSDKKFIRGRVMHRTPIAERREVVIKDDSGKILTLSASWFPGIKKGDRVVFCLDRNDNVINYFKEDTTPKPSCNSAKSVIGMIEEMRNKKIRQLTVEYGIESYFVEEGKGRTIESARNARNLKVEVSLKKDGKGIITGLLLDGK
ncbi:MAG: GDYXXLXY domain-containing protein [Nitrospirae bacterium]|nr:GDYXXLXY domain-containing protein [Nitrospirota bacterium]